MKKFTKGMLIAAGIFGAVGIGLTAAEKGASGGRRGL